MLCAILYIENSDKARFSYLRKLVENDYYLNKVEYPSTVTSFGWLVFHPPRADWDILLYESDLLLFYPELRNCYYSVKLIKYTSSLFLPLDRLPRLDPTSAPSGSSLEFSPHLCTLHMQAGRPTYLLWWYVAFLWILWWGGSPMSPSSPLPMDTPTIRLPHVSQ